MLNDKRVKLTQNKRNILNVLIEEKYVFIINIQTLGNTLNVLKFVISKLAKSSKSNQIKCEIDKYLKKYSQELKKYLNLNIFIK